MAKLAGRSALVTGAASPEGIGFATARLFAAEGARVCLADIDTDTVARAADIIRGEGGDAFAMQHDVSSETAWKMVIADVVSRFGALDILVNNAGIALPKCRSKIMLSLVSRL